MGWAKKVAKKVKLRIYMEQKVNSALTNIKRELIEEFEKNDIDLNIVDIDYTKDEEQYCYIIKVNSKEIKFSLDDISRNLAVTHNKEIKIDNIEDKDVYNEIVKLIEYHLL